MLNEVYLDIARMRYADMLKEAERERQSNEALRILRRNLPGRRPRMKLVWLSRWNPRGIWRAVAARG